VLGEVAGGGQVEGAVEEPELDELLQEEAERLAWARGRAATVILGWRRAVVGSHSLVIHPVTWLSWLPLPVRMTVPPRVYRSPIL
jgi:hypothetical protein